MMNSTAMSSGTRLTPPPDFPVTWRNPEHANYHWTRDREHMPHPITPMFNSAAAIMAIESRKRTVPVYDEAIVQRYDIPINHYLYTCLIPFSGTTEELTARARRNREKVSAVSARLEETWENEWRPELESHWEFWASFDLENADMPALRAHFEESLIRGARLYEIHYLMGPPMWFAIDEFETLYCDLFPSTTPLDAHRLLQGFDNKTLEIGRALWKLHDLAKVSPTIHQILSDLPADEAWAVLKDFEAAFKREARAPIWDRLSSLPEVERPTDLEACRAFVEALRAFLDAYGGRSDLWDWGYPSWENAPSPVINNLKNYLAQPDRDLEAELAEAAAEREAAIAEARRALTGATRYPRPVVERFEQLLKAAQIALVLTENHTYYIDFNGFGWIRRVILELGKRFTAQGQLKQADDIFYLEVNEVRAMSEDPHLDRSELAATRRAEIARWSRYPEPRELGTRPAKPYYLYSPDARRMLRYVGGFAAEAAPPQPEPGLLHGQAGSPGKVRGIARVIHTLSEAHRLKAGEILVTRTTSPPW